MTMNDRHLLEFYEDALRWTSKTIPYQRNITLTRWCVKNIPVPPMNYGFSLQQKLEQYEFFRDCMDRSVSRFLDLYNAAIIMAGMFFVILPSKD